MLTESQRESYNTNGYLLVKNLLDEKYIDEMFSTVVNLMKQYGGKLMEPYERFESWEDDTFNEALIQLRKHDKRRFSAVFEAVRSSLALNNICCSNSITDYVPDIIKFDA